MPAKAFENVWKSITGNPAANLSTARYTFVKYDANGDIIAATAAGVAIGVLYEGANVNQPAQVVAQGHAFIKLGGTVAAGAEVEVGAGGTAVVLAAGKAIGILAVGGVSGDIGTILLK